MPVLFVACAVRGNLVDRRFNGTHPRCRRTGRASAGMPRPGMPTMLCQPLRKSWRLPCPLCTMFLLLLALPGRSAFAGGVGCGHAQQYYVLAGAVMLPKASLLKGAGWNGKGALREVTFLVEEGTDAVPPRVGCPGLVSRPCHPMQTRTSLSSAPPISQASSSRS